VSLTVLLNGETTELPAGATVRDVLARFGRADTGVAVAVNLHVVPRQEHATRELADGDRVDVVTAVGGG
jgi:sulfur carrier protein